MNPAAPSPRIAPGWRGCSRGGSRPEDIRSMAVDRVEISPTIDSDSRKPKNQAGEKKTGKFCYLGLAAGQEADVMQPSESIHLPHLPLAHPRRTPPAACAPPARSGGGRLGRADHRTGGSTPRRPPSRKSPRISPSSRSSNCSVPAAWARSTRPASRSSTASSPSRSCPTNWPQDPAFVERFNREAKVLARLSHPNIVAVFDFGTAGPYCYLLMEYVDGVNLRQAMRTGGFTPAEALALVQDICAALQFAHEEGILHRDIKPENILIDSKGRVKIADFGIAKLVGAGAPIGRHPHPAGLDPRQPALHGARADRDARRRRPAGRHLLARGRALRNAHRRAADRPLRPAVAKRRRWTRGSTRS